MHNDSTYNKDIETVTPIPEKELNLIEKEMGFSYKQGIGELIYALVTCQSDVSYALIKLSQYSTRPARLYFEAVRSIYQYLKDAINKGINYWRTKPRLDCLDIPLPTTLTDYSNYTPHESKTTTNANDFDTHANASYSHDVTHRKSVTGIM